MRYYKAPLKGSLKETFDVIDTAAQRFHDYVRAFMKEIGATKCLPDAERGLIRAVTFPDGHKPSRLTWKKEGRGWSPKRNTIEGKKLAKRFESFPAVNWQPLWEAVHWKGNYFGERTAYFHPAFQLSTDKQWALFWSDEPGEWVPTENLQPITWDEWKELSGTKGKPE